MKPTRAKLAGFVLYLAILLMLATSMMLIMGGAAYGGELAPITLGANIAHMGLPTGVPACAACHGAAGEGNAAVGYPRLTGMPADYLAEQLTNFADGTRSNPMMNPVAKLLNAGDRNAVAAFYASLPSPAVNTSPAAHGLGEQIALHGNWSEGVPACVSCHGSQGTGVGAAFPALAGQSSIYIRNQLIAWKDGTRAPGPLGLMSAIARRLSTREADAVAGYFASLPATPKGDTP